MTLCVWVRQIGCGGALLRKAASRTLTGNTHHGAQHHSPLHCLGLRLWKYSLCYVGLYAPTSYSKRRAVEYLATFQKSADVISCTMSLTPRQFPCLVPPTAMYVSHPSYLPHSK